VLPSQGLQVFCRQIVKVNNNATIGKNVFTNKQVKKDNMKLSTRNVKQAKPMKSLGF
jgi:hypothetical protein